MKKCASCCKITKTKRVCVDCGRPLCYSCSNQKRLCNSCFMVKNDKAEVYHYLKDKEMDRLKRKGLTGIMYLLLFVFSGIMF